MSPKSDLIVVVFPAPFGPRKPKTSPVFMLKDALFTAFTSLNVFVRLETVIAVSSSCFLSIECFFGKVNMPFLLHSGQTIFFCSPGSPGPSVRQPGRA